MKRTVFIIFFTVIITQQVYAQSKSIVAVDTPTAYTIGRGTYLISTLFYDEGGVELKAIIGLHDSIDLGISFDVQDLIGTGTPQPNIPGVVARFQLTDHIAQLPLAIALGYDSFHIGRQGKRDHASNKYNRMIYGPYAAFTNTIFLFGAEQYISYGVRLPVQPDFVPEDASYFLGIDIPILSSFRIKTEMERVYYDFRSPDEWLVNIAARYTYLDQLGIELAFLIQMNGEVNRVVRLEYHGEF